VGDGPRLAAVVMSELALALPHDLDPSDHRRGATCRRAAFAQRLAPFLQPQGEDLRDLRLPR
ncbi:MAG TPA: hypothetical protein VGK33_16545, partial [Chloroflexota bacterium]